MIRKEFLGHELRYLHKEDAIQEKYEDRSLWYICENCNVGLYWNGGRFRTWSNFDYDFNDTEMFNTGGNLIEMDITCDECIIKKIIE